MAAEILCTRWTIVLLFLSIVLIYAWQKRIKWLPIWALICAVPVILLFKSIGELIYGAVLPK